MFLKGGELSSYKALNDDQSYFQFKKERTKYIDFKFMNMHVALCALHEQGVFIIIDNWVVLLSNCKGHTCTCILDIMCHYCLISSNIFEILYLAFWYFFLI